MGNLDITQPRVFEQHEIIGAQNVVTYDYKGSNVKYAMYVDF